MRSPHEIVFTVKTWEGNYYSKDIPGGVESTPVVGTIYTIGADGSNLRQVVQLGQNCDFPHFSPDGRWIYFQSNVTGRSHVYRCRLDGSEVANLTAGDPLGSQWKDAYGFGLSQNGKVLVYTVHDGMVGHVALARADGSDHYLLAPDLGYIYMSALSPDGNRVVFSGPDAGYRLKIMGLPEGAPLALTPDHPESFVPQFTPDGRQIIFFRRDGDVYSVDVDGQHLRRLTTGNGYVRFKLSDQDRHGSSDAPDISPDGRRIAMIALRGGVANVWVMNLDGTAQRQITFRNSPCGRVQWSPDGNMLAFVSFEGPFPQLFVVDVDGGEPRRLTDFAGAVYFLDW
ncbi:MAG: hypothetical protein EXR62_05310 [Chloroflexi bacterium]|nr:hypothetical protein [Chloroflexota bacterium]